MFVRLKLSLFRFALALLAILVGLALLTPGRAGAREAVANTPSFTLDTRGAATGPATGWLFQ